MKVNLRKLTDVKEGDLIVARVFSLRSCKWVTRRVRVYTCHVWNGHLMISGVYANKDGNKSKVQPRFGSMPMVRASELLAINP